MEDASENNIAPEPKAKKRKLRYPRTSKACLFCRKRKVRCSGNLPCEICVREEVSCEYPAGGPLITSPSTPGKGDAATTTRAPHQRVEASVLQTREDQSPLEKLRSGQKKGTNEPRDDSSSRRSSIEPLQTFTGESHVGPSSGVSFLYHSWDKKQEEIAVEESDGAAVEGHLIPAAPLISYGDIPQRKTSDRPSQVHFSTAQVSDICDRYFRYISPTYRFLHEPTVKSWATSYVTAGKSRLTAAQQACVLLVCAQTLLHSSDQPGKPDMAGNDDNERSMMCSERAKSLLESEVGPPSLASIQARIGMCLNLLSTFRLNECRFYFSFAVTVATALGIHRHQSSARIDTIELECRKRAFWSLYILDGYLSVMLGRPRLFRDEDIDQPYPQNVDDYDLVSSERAEDLPQHGNLEAMHGHINLAKIMGRNNDRLYPLHALTNNEILDRSNEMLDALTDWQKSLPEFLKPKEKTLTGQRTFERQNTILKLAAAHVRVLATRRCLLLNFGGHSSILSQSDRRAQRSLKECISAILTILDTVEALIVHGQCYQAFWTTQYIALVGISTFYVLLIQGLRHLSHGDTGADTILDLHKYLARMQKCHDHLARLPPPGSQAERHQHLLSHLRSKVERSLDKWRNNSSATHPPYPQGASFPKDRSSGFRYDQAISTPLNALTTHLSALTGNVVDDSTFASLPDQMGSFVQDANDFSTFSTMFTPGSSAESGLNYMFDFGWESLDVVGGNSLNDIFQFNATY